MATTLSELLKEAKIVKREGGYTLEDIPHLSDYIPDLPTYPNPLQHHPAYAVVRQYFVNQDDTVAKTIIVHKDGPPSRAPLHIPDLEHTQPDLKKKSADLRIISKYYQKTQKVRCKLLKENIRRTIIYRPKTQKKDEICKQ